MEPSVVDRFINTIKSYFGKITVTRCVKYKYVDIEIDFTGDGKVTLFQKRHFLECIENFR